jgi:hypothetical protein
MEESEGTEHDIRGKTGSDAESDVEAAKLHSGVSQCM